MSGSEHDVAEPYALLVSKSSNSYIGATVECPDALLMTATFSPWFGPFLRVYCAETLGLSIRKAIVRTNRRRVSTTATMRATHTEAVAKILYTLFLVGAGTSTGSSGRRFNGLEQVRPAYMTPMQM